MAKLLNFGALSKKNSLGAFLKIGGQKLKESELLLKIVIVEFEFSLGVGAWGQKKCQK